VAIRGEKWGEKSRKGAKKDVIAPTKKGRAMHGVFFTRDARGHVFWTQRQGRMKKRKSFQERRLYSLSTHLGRLMLLIA